MRDDDDERRPDAPHVRLSEGRTFFRREGAADGIPIVLVHGATVPHWEFDALVPPLLRAGFQTLRFDLYGHGTSDRPRGAYTFERFTRQVVEIVEATGFPQPPILLGHSFGAALAAAVAAERPALAARLVLVAPMLDFSSTSGWAKLFQPRVVGELAMQFVGVPGLIRRRRRRYAAIGRPQLALRFVEQATAAGFGRALLSMFRTGALGDKSAHYSALRAFEREVLVITGDHDAIIPAEHVSRVRALLPPHSHSSLPAEHNLLLTHPESVVDVLTRWLAARPATLPLRVE